MIELIDIHKSFNGIKALSDINICIQESEIFGIIGQSGAGKSTLLRLLNLLERPDAGKIIIDNTLISKAKNYELRQVRQKIALVFQHFNLVEAKTVFDNVALPMLIQKFKPAVIKARVEELLEVVGLQNKHQAYPLELSGGQKQRVAIARALSCFPKIVLCDEATSALDPETTDTILQLLQKINQLYGVTMVLITHEMPVVKRICHRVALMEQGRIMEVNSLETACTLPQSVIRQALFADLSPALPEYLTATLSSTRTNRPMLRLLFQGAIAAEPFISQTSRTLDVNINILLANIDRFQQTTCGVLVIELIRCDNALLDQFKMCCVQNNIFVESLGYVTDPVL